MIIKYKVNILHSHFHIPSVMKIKVVNLLDLKFTGNYLLIIFKEIFNYMHFWISLFTG